ncbi:glycosyltransferase [Streptococcus suis]|uniref:Glycosyltransferase n=1 Tax=Streptococcus suis TaxID=1307 RepID=A0A9X4MNA1_STRSU|nr:glycosyltransferase [Streptococcus suis]QCO71511.1 Glycosyltransferase [Streptococcus suis]
MKILHYTIGFAPERTGGLVSYVTDLMVEQKRQGHDVFALYPSSQLFFGKTPRIKVDKEKFGVKTFGLINSSPLPLFGGISTPSAFMEGCNVKIFISFLRELQPDVVHVHSLIGLYKEFLEAAKELNIRVVFTTHDYYGLAPIPSFYYNGVSFDENNSNLAWNIMSADALSIKKLRIFQSSLYPTIRKWLKRFNKNPKHKAYQDIDIIADTIDYSVLRAYYIEMFSLVDSFHFNSSLCQSIYKHNLPFIPKGKVITITNATIKGKCIKKRNEGKQVVAYIGPDEEYKGYFDFLEFTKSLDKNRFQINTYGHVPNEFAPNYINQMGRFLPSQIEDVYSNIDFLIIPSRWKETFGLITLEALSFGVTVYVSENVGSKDLVSTEYIFKDLNSTLTLIKQTNIPVVKSLEIHSREILSFYEAKNE